MNRKNLALAGVLLAAACNDTQLVDSPIPDPCAAETEPQGSPIVREPRSVGAGAFLPPMAMPPGAPTADELLAAMDVDPSGAVQASLSGHALSAAAFPGLGMVQPVEGSTFAWLSTGVAGAGTPYAVGPSDGTQQGTDLQTPGCLGSETRDCVQLRYGFVVPDDVHSIRFDFAFFSAEYPEYVNQGYNDTFVVSLTSPTHNFANVSFDELGRPINIDSAFFDEPCDALIGSGFDLGAGFSCDAGGTGRLTTQAPVEPGETVTLTFTLMDSGDGIYDSAVLLDGLVGSGNPIEEPETGEEPDPCD